MKLPCQLPKPLSCCWLSYSHTRSEERIPLDNLGCDQPHEADHGNAPRPQLEALVKQRQRLTQ